MKAVVTGGAGFIGSHLVEFLLSQGHRVTAFDDLSTGDEDHLAAVRGHPNLTFVKGSILDGCEVDAALDGSDTVFHLAAAVGVRTIVEHPIESLRTNVDGTEVVLETAARHGCRFLLTSSSEIYGKNSDGPLGEDDDRILGSPLKSRWSYAVAKGLDELLAMTYAQEQGLQVVIARLFNVTGPRQTGRYGMVVPQLIDQALRDAPMTVYGTGLQQRCFCSVHDIVPALVELAETPECSGQVFNLGSSTETTIWDLALRIRDVLGSASRIELVPYDRAYGKGYEDIPRRAPDTTRARQAIGFEPEQGLDDIIRSIAAQRQRIEPIERIGS